MAAKLSKPKVAEAPSFDWPFGRKNYVLFAVALVIIVIGYICLGYGDDPNHPLTLTVAPILLVLGYLLIPFAIMAKGKPDTGPDNQMTQ
ncbi:MAG: DUF3098 domain-containing protein [Candidatus Zixiibacteriota bacterium]